MNLTYSQIKEFTMGAENALETELGLCLYRFNEEELETYTNPERLGTKCFSSAGIRIAMVTDARELTLGISVTPGSSRRYFAVELFENGKRTGVLKNYEDSWNFARRRDESPFGEFEQTFTLTPGEKEVELYLPWTVQTLITQLDLPGATFARPAERNKILLMYGDSITQGYDAYLPSHSYSNRLADALGMQVVNKAIGGEVFYPRLAECTPTVAPTAITVAYGTNDFSRSSLETFEANSRSFFETLAAQHPGVPILAITPIWRADWQSERKIPSFHAVGDHLRAIAKTIPAMQVIDGFGLIPQDTVLYADLRLHPNDDGFTYYAENLIKAVRPLLENC